jgi:hypothetical protein
MWRHEVTGSRSQPTEKQATASPATAIAATVSILRLLRQKDEILQVALWTWIQLFKEFSMRRMLGIGLLATTVTMNAAEEPLVWKNGNPPELAAENPYLPALNANVSRALHLLKQGKGEHPFYLVWGATAPGSKHRDNAELRDLAYKGYDDVTRQRVEKPCAFWDIIGDLEALLLWQFEGKVPKEQIAIWQERLRPSLEANIKSVTDEKSWIEWAANTLLQSSTILQLAAVSYRRENPDDPNPDRWERQARVNLRKALRIQLPGGAFSYIRHSGPDPVYFAFDTAHLGRYYQLTGDRRAKTALVRLAQWGDAATVCGWITSSAPVARTPDRKRSLLWRTIP